jgi:hypothetical protein
MSLGKSNMSIETASNVMMTLSPNISVLLRGDHGIGKSQIVRQIAKKRSLKDGINYRVIDRRISQMSEGDILGLPKLENDTTKWCLMDWFMTACTEPCILFLDELNRGSQEVQNAVFQIVLDRELDGRKLHPNTICAAAINDNARYQVNEMDPALLDRFFVIDLFPSTDEWVSWAREEENGVPNVDPLIVNFIQTNDRWLDPPADTNPGAVTPSRRSWERLSKELVAAKVVEDTMNQMFHSLCLGFIGTEATADLQTFGKTFARRVTAEEVINGYLTNPTLFKRITGGKDVKTVTNETWNELVDKVSHHITSKMDELTDEQAKNVGGLFKNLPFELRMTLWHKISAPGLPKIKVIQAVHKYSKELVLESLSMEINKQKAAETKETEAATVAETPETAPVAKKAAKKKAANA